MSSKELVPEIRFEGFEGEWVPTTLGEISGLPEYGMNIAAGPYDGKNIYLRITDIDEETGRLNRSELTSPRADMRKMENFKMTEGDIAFARTGASVGKSYLYDEKDGDLFYAGFLIRFPINKQIINPGFVYQNTLTENYNKFVKANSQRSGQPGLNSGEYSQFEFLKPTLKEQNEITGLLNNIDNVIVRKKEETNSLLNFKQAMLQKMFPKEGEKVPEIRFEGFNKEWEITKLDDVAEFYSGGTPSVGNKKYYKGNIPFIRSAEINKSSTELYISEVGLKNSSAKMVDIGTILYALYGATSGEVGISKINGAINQAILAIKPSSNYDSNFIMQWLKYQKNNITDKYLQGGQGNLSGSIIKKIQIMIPSLSEQKLIGEYFYKLDQNIQSKQAELDKLKQFKQAMLDKMFV